MSRFLRRVAGALVASAATAGMLTALAPLAEGAVAVRVQSQISAHYLPYLASPYIPSSTLTAGQSVAVDCRVQGREAIGGSSLWYRVGARYYPAYAFATSPVVGVLCGQSKSVPAAANGYSSPSFSSTPKAGLFATNDSIMVLCTAQGSSHAGSNAWFFSRGYWLHSSRIAGGVTGRGFATCAPGYRHPISNDFQDRDDGYNAGQCTAFVSWRLFQRNNLNFHNYYGGSHFGNANTWDEAARAEGIPVNGTPKVGSVMQSDAGTYGHVAWVAALNADGTVLIEEYNFRHELAYDNTRVVSRSGLEFIHFPTSG
jgi:surface antigen